MKTNFEKHDDLRNTDACPIRNILDRIGDQWSLLVLGALSNKTLRFNELKRDIGDISQHMLARTLKRLEEDGLISQKLFPVIPPRVDYALTPLGKSLLRPMNVLISWAEKNYGKVEASRHAFQKRL